MSQGALVCQGPAYGWPRSTRHSAHLPRAPAPTRSPPATTGTPCRPPCRWPAGAAAGPTGRSAPGTAAPAPRTVSASVRPRSRRRSGHCLRGGDVGSTPVPHGAGQARDPWALLLQHLDRARPPHPAKAHGPRACVTPVSPALRNCKHPSDQNRPTPWWYLDPVLSQMKRPAAGGTLRHSGQPAAALPDKACASRSFRGHKVPAPDGSTQHAEKPVTWVSPHTV